MLAGLYALTMLVAAGRVHRVACVFKGIDLTDLDSDPVGRIPPTLLEKAREQELISDDETRSLQNEIEDARDKLRVTTDLGRKLNPEYWGKTELGLFDKSNKLKKSMNAMYGIGGGFVAMGTAFESYSRDFAPILIGILLYALSVPFWVAGKRADKKRQRAIKELMNAEARRASFLLEMERSRLRDKDIAAAVLRNKESVDEDVAHSEQGA